VYTIGMRICILYVFHNIKLRIFIHVTKGIPILCFYTYCRGTKSGVDTYKYASLHPKHRHTDSCIYVLHKNKERSIYIQIRKFDTRGENFKMIGAEQKPTPTRFGL
jgi:hypothetical protein